MQYIKRLIYMTTLYKLAFVCVPVGSVQFGLIEIASAEAVPPRL